MPTLHLMGPFTVNIRALEKVQSDVQQDHVVETAWQQNIGVCGHHAKTATALANHIF